MFLQIIRKKANRLLLKKLGYCDFLLTFEEQNHAFQDTVMYEVNIRFKIQPITNNIKDQINKEIKDSSTNNHIKWRSQKSQI